MRRTSAILALAVILAAPGLSASYQYNGLWARPGLSLQALLAPGRHAGLAVTSGRLVLVIRR